MSSPATIDHSSLSADALLVTDVFLQNAKDLVAIRSTHDRPVDLKRALELVEALIMRYPGITIEQFERKGVHSFLAYYGTKRPERFDILLNGHVDVVAGHDAQFAPYIESNRLYGRGALDMKVSTLVLAEAFCKTASQVPYALGLQVVTDEEIGGYDGAAYQFEQGVTTDFYITGEQSANDIVAAVKGICWLKLVQKGKTSHGAYPWLGDNALLKLTALIQKIHEVYPVPTKETWNTTASIAQLKSHTEGFFNRVPDSAEVHIDFRFIPGDPNFVTKDAVRAFIASLDPTVEVKEFVTFEGAPFAELDHPLLQHLLTTTSQAKGSPSRPIRRYAGSDARHLMADPAMRAIEYGVGGAFEHSNGEYADLTSVAVMRAALPAFLLSAHQHMPR